MMPDQGYMENEQLHLTQVSTVFNEWSKMCEASRCHGEIRLFYDMLVLAVALFDCCIQLHMLLTVDIDIQIRMLIRCVRCIYFNSCDTQILSLLVSLRPLL